MTKLLEQALVAVSKLPETEQDAIAALILEKIAEKTAIESSPLTQSDIETLEQSYTFRDKTEVVQFIEKYPFLLAPLLEAPDKIRPLFPNDELRLEVSYDPEIVNYVHLVLSILSKDNPNKIVSHLNRLDKDWGLSLSSQVRQKFFTTLGYPDEF